MTLYHLYLRSRIRREALQPREAGCAAQPFTPSSAGREECPSMIYGDHRYSYVIAGCEEFEAENDAAALAIARAVFDAASDLCDAFELWAGARQIDQRRMATLPISVVTAQWQEHVIRAEEALLNSRWAIAHSRRLLSRVTELRQEATRRHPVAPAPTEAH